MSAKRVLDPANANLIKAQERNPNIANMAFKQIILPQINMEDGSVDVVLSNYVFNPARRAGADGLG